MLIHLQAAGTSFVLDARGPQPPSVVHWGAALGDLTDDDLAALVSSAVPAVPPSSLDTPPRLSLLPTLGDGWSGRPAIGKPVSLSDVSRPSPAEVRITSGAAGLEVVTEIEMSPQGVPARAAPADQHR
ncbi:hypothetical protein OWR29_15405 [Actinoplanes sp. Pm04-4]|uniref:Alpha-galactosidase n=1 Tax=Paractinoplanes pyxinae TaxID=2997416 RepID=A0ABT4AYT9_9ACTN|nr:hypothetical protein [Actinoplanes pyxinae]MCY1139385.1 hypothetical protein [Actinoplanes pyxinae]